MTIKNYTCLFLLLTGLITTISCKDTLINKEKVSIAIKNFEDEVALKQTLVFTFNKDLVSDEKDLNTWVFDKYIEFDPPIEGKFKWMTPQKLLFSPLDILPPSTSFKGTPSDLLLSHTTGKKKLVVDKTDFTFNTPFLELVDSYVQWKKSTATPDGIVLKTQLKFNSEINPKDLAPKLKISIDGEPLTFNIITQSIASNIIVEVNNAKKFDAGKPIDIVVEDGMKVLTSNWTNPEDFVLQNIVPEKERLVIKSVTPNHDGFKGSIYVSTNQELDAATLEANITLDPNIAFTTDLSDNGFVLNSDEFALDKSYEIMLTKSLTGILGGTLSEPYNKQFTFGKVEPKIKFTNEKAMYLGAEGNRNLSVEIVNVPELNVEIIKVFENNLQAFFREGRRSSSSYRDGNRYRYNYYNTGNYGQSIYSEKILSKDLPSNGGRKVLNIDFEDKIRRFDGVYVVQVTSADKNWLTDARVIALSDVGLIVKAEENKIFVFANSIKTAEPLPNVSISFFSDNNQNIYTTKTDEEGVAIFDNISEKAPKFSINMITAENGSDFNFIHFNKTYVNASRFDIGGKYPNSTGYDTFLYGERDIYRPGETINIAGIVRDQKMNVSAEMPIKIKIIMPNGKTFKTIQKVLSQDGGFDVSVPTTNDMQTGMYNVSILTANDLYLASRSISLEEFMPDRIKVKLDLSVEEISLHETDEITADIEAVNFFGPPAANRNYEVELSLKRQNFYSKKHPKYTFNNSKSENLENIIDEGKTDANGKASKVFKIKDAYKDLGILNGRVFATVFDETGRPVNKAATFKVHTQDIYYGIGRFDYYLKTQSPVTIPLIAVDKDGEALNGVDANMQIIRKEWRTVLQKNSSGYYSYLSQKQEIVLENRNIRLDGTNTNFMFTPKISGEYEIRIMAPDSKYYTKRQFRAYGWGDTQSTSFEVNNEGNVEIEFDKEKYNVGETVNILFKTPFVGKMLVTLEQDEVLRHFYVDTDKKSAELSFELTDREVPTVYVTATLIKPHTNNEMPLMIAHGFKGIEVHNPNNKIPINIEAVEKSRSKTRQNIRITSLPDTELTIAVVDEGILQLKNTKTPDPYNYFYQKRALGVQSYDLYPFLYPEIVGKKSLSGGDGGMNLAKRVNPLSSKRVKLTRFWSGLIKTDATGIVDFPIDIPQFSGDLRIMVVAHKAEKMGNAEMNMKVADPVVISTALARFLSPNDKAKIPVTISNTTDKNASGKVWIKTEGPLAIEGDEYQDITIPANSEAQIEFEAVAQPIIDHAKVLVQVEALGETFSEEIDIPVRPASSLQKKSGSGAVQGSTTETISWASKYIPSSIDGRLIVSGSPLLEFAKNLEYLVGYPHGCVEQTVSKAFPQLYYNELTKDIIQKDTNLEEESELNPNYNVQVAIDKLTSMQMSSGALTYWPGRGSASWWGSIYALHFMHEAKKLGFEVNDYTIKQLTFYLKNRLKDRETSIYYYNRSSSKEIAAKEVAYSLFVLALVGEPQISTMNYYKARLDALSLDSKYLLAASYALAGDKRKFTEIVPNNFKGEIANKSFGGSFYSYVRDLGIALYSLLEVNPDDQQIPILTKQLAKEVKTRKYMNTQERVFSFLALGKVAQQANAGNATATIIANGNTVKEFTGQTLTFDYHEINTGEFSINAEGNGNVYYFWDIEGITMNNEYEEKDNFLRIRKTLLDRTGKAISLKSIKQNDLVVVKLNLQSLTQSKVENVVISDILPAGFEVENPRLDQMPASVSWAKTTRSDFFDVRDDRVHFFTTAYKSKDGQNFYYVVRAVSKGTYIMGPASADAMYDGEYHSYHGGGTVTIVDK